MEPVKRSRVPVHEASFAAIGGNEPRIPPDFNTAAAAATGRRAR
jgi:hypothetical protein